MGSSTTIQSHPAPPPPSSTTLSNLQNNPSSAATAAAVAGGSNLPESSSTTTTTTSTNTTSPPVSVPPSRGTTIPSNTNRTNSRESLLNSIHKEGEVASVTTTVSFATPENSPFSQQKKVTELTSTSSSSSGVCVNSTTPSRTRGSGTDHHSSTIGISATAAMTPSTACTADSIADTTMNACPNTTTCMLNGTHSKAKSVTPQAKCVKFQGDQRGSSDINNEGVIISSAALTGATAGGVGSHSDCGATAVSVSSSSQSSSANIHVPHEASSSLTLNLSSDSSENFHGSANTTTSNAILPTSSSHPTHDATSTTIMNSSVHYHSSVSRRGGKVTSPGRNRAVSNTSDQLTPPLLERKTSKDLNSIPANSSSQNPSENHTNSTTSPRSIPSLQPRKLSDTTTTTNTSTTLATATTPTTTLTTTTTSTTACNESISIAPSLCSSNSNSPENNEIHAKNQLPVQYLQQRNQAENTNGQLSHAPNANSGASTTLTVKQEPTTLTASNTNPSTINNSNNNITVKANSRINSCSPVPAPRPTQQQQQQIARTPVRSPRNSRSFNVDFGSPGGIFLSPYLPSPPDSRKVGFTGVGNGMNGGNGGTMGGGGMAGNDPRGNKTASPTNFAKDFGKTDLSSSSFDATNVLPWLSPTTYSLFSPGGGIASASNTPGGIFSSTLPRSPNVNKLTLPLTNDVMGGLENKKKVNGISSMICVSPLASRKNASANAINIATAAAAASVRNDKHDQSVSNHNPLVSVGSTIGGLSQPDTPINFREVFASPKNDLKGVIPTEHSNEIPTIRETMDGMCGSLSLEKHMAERDVREDEDLNVLLKLAETTPNRKAAEPKPTSRPFRAQFTYSNHPGAVAPPPPIYSMTPSNGEPPATLQLPYIGKNTTGPPLGGKATKKNSPESASSDDFSPPPLPIRTNSATPSKRSKKSGEKGQAGKTPFPKKASGPTPPKTSLYPYPPPHMRHQPPPGAYPPAPPHYMHGPYYSYPPQSHPTQGHPTHSTPPYSMYSSATTTPSKSESAKKGPKVKTIPANKVSTVKRQLSTPNTGESKKRQKKSSSRKGGKRTRTTVTQPLTGPEREKSAATITAINAATGNKNDKAASLASAILRGVTMRPSGKWQAQLYYAGKSRYIGVFDTREKAALAYEIAREKLKTDRPASEQSAQSIKETEANVNAARKAAFEGVNEKDPRNGK